MPKNFDSETAIRAREQINEQKDKYRQSYSDDDYWKDLARDIGIRLPPFYSRPCDQSIKHWLKVCRVNYTQFVEAFGWKDAEEFEQLNPLHGMKLIAGLILELREENTRIRKIARERCQESEARLGDSEPPRQRSYVGKSKARRRLENNLPSTLS